MTNRPIHTHWYRVQGFRRLFAFTLAAGVLYDVKTFLANSRVELEAGDRLLFGLFGARVFSPAEVYFALFSLLGALLWLGLGRGRAWAPALIAFGSLLVWGGMGFRLGFKYQVYGVAPRIFDNLYPALLLLAAVPKMRSPKSEEISRWILTGIKINVLLTYFGSGYSKLVVPLKPFAWLGGEALQSYLLVANAMHGSSISLWLANHFSLCVAISWFVVGTELAAPLALFGKKATWIFLVLAVPFHLFAELVMDVNFFLPFFLPTFLIFFPAVQDWAANFRLPLRKAAAMGLLMVAFGSLSFAASAEEAVNAPASGPVGGERYRPPNFLCLRPDDKLLFRPKENCEASGKNVNGSFFRYRYNELGLADKDYSRKAAPGKVRVLLLGESILVAHFEGAMLQDHLTRALGSKRFETINAAVNGFSLVQIFLFLPDLLERYQPDLVVFPLNLNANGLKTVFHHWTATGRDSTGLATMLGPHPGFWPLPGSWAPGIWKSKYALPLLLYSTVAHELFLLGKNKFFSSETNPEILEQYLQAIISRVEEKGAKILLLRASNEGGPVLDFKAESYTQKFWPAPLFPPESQDQLFERLCRGQAKCGDIRAPVRELCALRNCQLQEDVHLSKEGAQIWGEVIGKAIRSAYPDLSR